MPRTKNLTTAQQQLHSVGTCPHCSGAGRRSLPVGHGLHLLPCGPCGGSGSSR